jgi:glutaredoxin
MQRLFIFGTLLFMSFLAMGQTLYKSVGRDGRVTYSDRPIADGGVEKTLRAHDLPNTAIPEKTPAEIAALQKSAKPSPMSNAGTLAPVKSAKLSVSPNSGVLLFSATWCGYCRQAKAFLAQHGVAYNEKDIDSAEGKMAFEQAGGGGVPLLLTKGTAVRGFSRESYDALFPSNIQ